MVALVLRQCCLVEASARFLTFPGAFGELLRSPMVSRQISSEEELQEDQWVSSLPAIAGIISNSFLKI